MRHDHIAILHWMLFISTINITRCHKYIGYLHKPKAFLPSHSVSKEPNICWHHHDWKDLSFTVIYFRTKMIIRTSRDNIDKYGNFANKRWKWIPLARAYWTQRCWVCQDTTKICSSGQFFLGNRYHLTEYTFNNCTEFDLCHFYSLVPDQPQSISWSSVFFQPV